MRTEIIKITKQMADAWLSKNPNNRPINHPHLENLKKQHMSGNFKLTGESIIIDWHGNVLDGQHRLRMVSETDIPITNLVVFDADPATFSHINTGKIRSKSDVTAIAMHQRGIVVSVAVTTAIAAAARLASTFRPGVGFKEHYRAVPNQQVVNYIQDHPEIIRDVTDITDFGRWCIPAGIMGAVLHLVRPGFPSAYESFIRPLHTGAGLSDTSPILKLRNIANQYPRPPQFQNHHDQVALVVKAWNAHATGTPIKMLRYSGSVESYPVLIVRP